MSSNNLSATGSRFLDLLLASGALKFGEFKTKSGRLSPYFFNTGCFDSGRVLNDVAACYSDLILSHFDPKQIHLYGPAYKGIPLATSIAQELAKRTGQDIPFTFNRKEAKAHGEGGSFIGRSLNKDSKLIIVEDVMTGGTSIRETLALLKPIGASIEAVIIGVDREERGSGDLKAAVEMTKEYGIPVHAILRLQDILGLLWNKPRQGRVWVTDEIMQSADTYQRQFG